MSSSPSSTNPTTDTPTSSSPDMSPSTPSSAADSDRSSPAPREKRWSARRKVEIALRALRGESLDALSRELNLPVARIAQWRDEFLDAGQAALKSRPPEPSGMSEEERRAMQAKVGELTMENELLREKARALEAGRPLASRRSKR